MAPLVGCAAALVTPWQLKAPRLNRLLADAGTGREQGDPRSATRWAHRMLRLLARLPRSPWRNSCLYRSAAECLALRWLGWPAVLRIGVQRSPSRGEVLAHAWVEGPSAAPEPEGRYRVLSLRPPRPS